LQTEITVIYFVHVSILYSPGKGEYQKTLTSRRSVEIDSARVL